ncbi:MAG TPA: hypothetical protein VKA18_15100 [Alphaproteobacteria bacterium]|nr:hypothetical protein [Alphaproteobacteria bacterium]
MEIVTFKNDSEGGTVFDRETVTFQLGMSDFLAASPLISAAQSCKRYFFSELPQGYYSSKDFSSRRQICVLLSGELEVMSTGGQTERFVAGDVLRLEDTNFQIPGRTVRVTSECPARILNVQIE